MIFSTHIAHRAEKAVDYGKTGVEAQVSRATIHFLVDSRRAKTAPGRGTRYACV